MAGAFRKAMSAEEAIKKLEIAGGIIPGVPEYEMPYKKGEAGIPYSGGVAKEWTGPTQKELQRKATGGSPPFSDAELKQGYRKVVK